MPQTRDQRCRIVIKNFLEQEDILNDTYYTLNKVSLHGWKLARYEITIPKTWYERRPSLVTNDESYELNWVTDELQQELPSEQDVQNIITKFKEKFEPHEKYIIRSHGKKTTSFMRIYLSQDEDNDDNENLRFDVLVQYNKKEIPFPEDIDMEQRVQKLERENESLRNKIRMAESVTQQYQMNMRSYNNRLKNQRDDAIELINTCHHAFNVENQKYMNMYRNIINKQYLELNKTFECPVCYEKIANEKIFTTPCNHVLCIDCSNHCKNTCPMCRDNMCYIIEDIN